MKKVLFLFCCLFVSSLVTAQDFLGKGVFVKGLIIEREQKWKEKVRTIFKETVITVNKDTKAVDFAQIGVKKMDSNRKTLPGTWTNYVFCDGKNYTFDIRHLVELDGNVPMFVFDNSYRFEGDGFTLPLMFKEGEKLNDVNVKVQYKMSDGKEYPTDFTFADRKVEGKETITTPAGSFDCIRYSWKMENSKPGQINLDSAKTSVYWVSNGLIVKTEQRDKKGKVLYSTQIILK